MAVSRKLSRLTKLADRLANKNVMIGYIRESLEGDERALADLNRKQLLSGLRSDDTPIRNKETGSALHARKKKPFTLKDTGAFHRSITARLAPRTIIFSASDSKEDLLKQRFGKTILGLGEIGRQGVIRILKRDLPGIIKKQL